LASNTPNLNLMKKDPATDGNETFNIQTMLNDNWDKIDAAVGGIDIPDATLTVKGKVQLSSSTASDAENLAATPKAVKTAYEAATAAQAVANAANTMATTAESKANNAIVQLADVTAQGVRYAVDTGTANVKVVTLSTPVPMSYFEGMAIAFKNKTQNTGAVTINVNGLGEKSILKSTGSALASGNLKADSIYTIRYNGVNFILQGEGGEYGTATAADVLNPKTIPTETGIVVGTMPNRGVFNLGFGSTVPAGYYSGGSVPSGKRTVTYSGISAASYQELDYTAPWNIGFAALHYNNQPYGAMLSWYQNRYVSGRSYSGYDPILSGISNTSVRIGISAEGGSHTLILVER
jgi:hypothetical protein